VVIVYCPVLLNGASLVKERSRRGSLDRSRQLRERCRSFSNSFAPRPLS